MWFLYASLAAIIWGLSYTLDERVLKSHISPFFIMACIGLCGGITFAVVSYFTKAKADLALLSHNKSLLWLFIVTIIVANLGTLFITLSIQAKNATLAAIIELSYPIFTILFSWLLFKENYLNIKVIIGGIFILGGAALIGTAG